MSKLKNWVSKLFGSKPTGNPEGISEFKSILKTGFEIVKAYNSANIDGKVTGLEWVSIGRAALPLISNAKNWKLLKEQALDFTTQEGIELAEYAVSLGILKSDAHKAIVHIISAIEKGYSIYKDDIKEVIRILGSK
jgi:hypothetical protein